MAPQCQRVRCWRWSWYLASSTPSSPSRSPASWSLGAAPRARPWSPTQTHGPSRCGQQRSAQAASSACLHARPDARHVPAAGHAAPLRSAAPAPASVRAPRVPMTPCHTHGCRQTAKLGKLTIRTSVFDRSNVQMGQARARGPQPRRPPSGSTLPSVDAGAARTRMGSPLQPAPSFRPCHRTPPAPLS